MQISLSLNLQARGKKYKPQRDQVPDLFNGIRYMSGAKGEIALTNRVALELKALFQEGRLNCLWYHVPNETSAKPYVKLCMGMIPGVPDFTFIKGGEPLTLLVELKTDTGALSANQKLFMKWAKLNGTPYEVARSWPELRLLLIKYDMVAT